jgi:hypothetical protein
MLQGQFMHNKTDCSDSYAVMADGQKSAWQMDIEIQQNESTSS